MSLAAATVGYHIQKMQMNLNARNRAALVAMAFASGLFLQDCWFPELAGTLHLGFDGSPCLNKLANPER
jgi:hypothetical protein